MTDKKTRRLPPARMLALAAVAGLVAGAAAVYVKETGSGNGAATETADAARCAATGAKIASVTPFLKGQVAAMSPADPARPLDGLVFNGPDGKAMSLTDIPGKTTLVNLWATWCVPCREEMPALDALQKELGSDRFEVVAINIDTGDDTKPKAFLTETAITSLAYYRDASMGVFNTLKKEGLAFGLPVTLLVDEAGCLIGGMNGPAAWDSADAKALIGATVAP